MVNGKQSLTKIVAFGDSTTALADGVCVYTERIKRRLIECDLFAEVINTGVKLNTTSDARTRIEKDVISQKPDITIMQFGINDATVDVWKDPPEKQPRVCIDRYEQNVRYIIQRLREINSEILIMSPNPLCWTEELKKMYGKPPYLPERVDGMNILLADYAKRVIQIAKELNVYYVDIYSVYRSEKDWLEGKFLVDGIHPNDVGHQLVVENLWPVLYDMLTKLIGKSSPCFLDV